jgi:hypothetical protein
VRRPAAADGRHDLMARLARPNSQLGPAGSSATRRARCPWSPRDGHTCGGGLARPAASSRATRCGGTGGDSSHKKRGRCRARWDRRRCTEALHDEGAAESAQDGGIPVEGGGGGSGDLWGPRQLQGVNGGVRRGSHWSGVA